MTLSNPRLYPALLLSALLAVPAAATAAPSIQSSDAPAARNADASLQLAQKSDDDDKDKKGKKQPNKKKDDKGGGGPGKDPGAEAAKAKAAQQKAKSQDARERILNQRQKASQDKQNALKKRQDAIDARQKAVKENPAADDNAKAKRLEALQAREKAVKAKQDAEAARQQAIKQKQLDAQQAKDKALKAKADAQADRDNAIKKKQLDAQQAKDKALQSKEDADLARRKLIQGNKDALDAQQKAIKAKEAADDARKGSRQPDDRKKGHRLPEKYDRQKVDSEFDRARRQAQEKGGRDKAEKFQPSAARKFEDLRRGRKTREVGKRDIIIEPDKRVIVRSDKRVFIRHDENERFKRRRELRRERHKDGTITVVTLGLAGALVYSLLDDDGRVLRRARRDREGREVVFFDDREYYRERPRYVGPGYYGDAFIDLPPPVVRIPRDRYIVDYDRASPDDLYETLDAPPIESLDRRYSLDEVRQNYPILERMRRVDLDAINFEFASWDVPPDQYAKLDRLARAIQRVIDRSPGELFLVEGHTDAVGSEIDNLSLSDRRAESVANILTDHFGIPPENLSTQGYGEEQLKELTDGPSEINRRVSIRRITPLLSRQGGPSSD